MAGVQCLKRLYLQVHHPEFAGEPEKSIQARIRQGQEVGELARKAFPGGVVIEAGDLTLAEAIDQTSQLVADRDVQTIFEGTFKQDNIVVRTDILSRKPRGRWQLVEVKASTDVKEHHCYDVGIQQYVLNAAHIEASPCLMYLNRNYAFNGREYDLGRLFKVRKLGPEIEQLCDQLPEMVRQQRSVLSRSDPPEIAPGPQCKNPVLCEFYDCCNLELPEDHVQLLPSISSAKVNEMAAKGIISVHDIPADFALSERQRRACRCIQTQTPYFAKGLKEVIGELIYPLYFMDFETLNPALPRFAGMRPYDPIPFQWSVHVRRTPGTQPEHHEFLAEDPSDPRLPFLTSLLKAVGHEGHVIVYNRGFESQRLEELADWLPEYAGQIAQVRPRLWDLLDAIRKNVYHPRFRGSFSLKNVLPALVPDMTYEGMEVSEGDEAGLVWEKIVRGSESTEEKARLRKALLDYCRQDTLAMIRLLDFLAEAPPSGT